MIKLAPHLIPDKKPEISKVEFEDAAKDMFAAFDRANEKMDEAEKAEEES
jgi:hypothetical protein